MRLIGHFTVVSLVTRPLSGSEAGVDLVLIQTLLLFIYKYVEVPEHFRESPQLENSSSGEIWRWKIVVLRFDKTAVRPRKMFSSL